MLKKLANWPAASVSPSASFRRQPAPAMNDFSPCDLKTILHFKRANLYYLEHCRVAGQWRARRVCDRRRQALAVLEHSDCQHHDGVAGNEQVHHPGGDARIDQGGCAGGLLRWWWNAAVQRQQSRCRLADAAKRIPPDRIPAALGAFLVRRRAASGCGQSFSAGWNASASTGCMASHCEKPALPSMPACLKPR